MRYADVVVIGAGVLGTFHAYHAARKGYKTILLELLRVAASAGQ